MSAVVSTKMGRKPKPDAEVRALKITSYVTSSEKIAYNKLATDYDYEGGADAIRKALALLVKMRHPELLQYFRSDLQEP